MRLIGTFETEKEAYAFYSFLQKEQIQNIYESFTDAATGKKQYRCWIFDEDDFQEASDWLDQFRKNPNDPRFQQADLATATPPTPRYEEVTKEEHQKWRTTPIRRPPPRFRLTLTHLILLLCVFLFTLDDIQERFIASEKGPLALNFTFTPVEQNLLFDYTSTFQCLYKVIAQYPLTDIKETKDIPPDTIVAIKQAEAIPSWRGIYPFFLSVKSQGWDSASANVSLFDQIRQGQVWRLFTPCLLHQDFLHILFNMAWLWFLGKQIEDRIRWWKMGILILIIGIISNVAQYFMSGPYFLGFSGVVVGMAGFIWMRQRKASWEGYPLSRGTLLFLLLFVVSMAALQMVSFTLNALSILEVRPTIANTAHIVGGITGLILGRFSFFGRGRVT